MNFQETINQYYKMTEEESAARYGRFIQNMELVHASLGLAGEAGELVDLIKKSAAYGKALDNDKVLEEAGDVLHCLCRILTERGLTLEQAKEANLAKLAKRYPNGYSNQAAVSRSDKVVVSVVPPPGLSITNQAGLPIELQEGKRYRRRDGCITDKLVPNREDSRNGGYIFWDPKYQVSYVANGKFSYYGSEDEWDLIELIHD